MNDILKNAPVKGFRTITAKYNKLESFWERTQFGVFSEQPNSHNERFARFPVALWMSALLSEKNDKSPPTPTTTRCHNSPKAIASDIAAPKYAPFF